MKTSFINKQKAALEKELENLKTEIKNLKTYLDNGSSVEDVALEIEQFETAIPLEKKLNDTLKEARAAIKRIENENYGVCAKCKQAIEEGRLELVPYAKYCASCQTKVK